MAIKTLRDRLADTKSDLERCSELSCIEQTQALDTVMTEGFIFLPAGKAREYRTMNWFTDETTYGKVKGRSGYFIPINKL